MGEIVVSGAKLACSFGSKPGSISVTSQSKCMIAGKPAATIQDAKPRVNISDFGMCSSMLNPQVQAATTAALGVLTPQPCAMAPIGVWTSVKPKLLLDKKPCLCSGAMLTCSMGMGIITISSPGQKKVIT